jgi:glucose/arabinose dehydrogenase
MTPCRFQVFAVAGSIACLALGAGNAALAQQSRAPGAQAAPLAARGGRGRPVTKPLEDGPWDFDTEKQPIHVTVVTKGLDHPWGMAFLPDGSMLVTERPGRLRIVRDGKLDPAPIAGLPKVRAAVIGGLQDIELDPKFKRNHLLYLSYSKPNSQDESVSTLAVAQARYEGGDKLEDVHDIYIGPDWYGPQVASSNNRCCGQGPADGSFGARMVFGKDDNLYIASGDRNWGEKAQDPSSDLGKILRIDTDGSIPRNNPFADKEAYRPEIYTLGHRNPTGLTVDPDGHLWSTEFGPRGGDELNRIEAGHNYGWILVTHGQHYNGDPVARGTDSVPGMTDPVLHWEPSINPGNIAFVDKKSKTFPMWRGDLLMATMTHALVRISFDDDGNPTGQEKMLTELGQRLRDVREGPDGLFYVLTDETAGAMLRIEPREQ